MTMIYFAKRFRLFAAAIAAMLLLYAADARAGGGPENVLLVVNSRSWSSLTVANHFIRLRKIPASNVVYLDWTLDNERIDAETARTKLLLPVLQEIDRRNIGDHIDYVVYSTDFPWAVDLSAETKGAQLPQFLTPTASLNGVTFLYQKFLARKLELLDFEANAYFRPTTRIGPPESQAFRGWYGWGKGGKLLEAGGERYLLSTMLGITSGRGMSTDDVVRNLTRSVGADFSRPTGTIYFARNDDVRSKTRHDLFPAAVEALEKVEVQAAVVSGVLPQGKNDVAGLMIGSAQFAWRDARSVIRPGAICEHLTSTGGVMSEDGGQTPLTELLLNGAAGASGAVTEPFAIPFKFPSPFVHLHYARGCTLAEAFYQAVSGPYQLLIVGDPLCRPWADPPRVSVAGLEPNAVVSGTATLKPTSRMPFGTYVGRYELYVDGILAGTCESGETIDFDSRKYADGFHELRLMAVAGMPIESRGGVMLPITSDNHGRAVEFTRIGDGPVRWGEPLRVRLKCDGALGMVVGQGSRVLLRVQGGAAEATIDPQLLGLGPVTIQAAAVGSGGPTTNAMSQPLAFDVLPPPPLPSFKIIGGAQFSPGLRLLQDDGEPVVVNSIASSNWLASQGVKPGEKFKLEGFFTVDRDGVFQFQLQHNSDVALIVDERPVYRAAHTEPTRDYVPLSLQHGLHKLEIVGTAAADARLDVRFGFDGMRRLKPVAMTHIP